MNPRTFFVAVLQAGLAGVVLLLSHYNYTWLAAILVLMPTAATWLASGRNREAFLLASPSAVIGLSVVVLVGLSRPPVGQPVFSVATQIILTIGYAAWLIWLRQLRLKSRTSLLVLAVQQFFTTAAIFLAAAFWRWSEAIVIILMWGTIAGTTWWYLRVIGERAAPIIAVSWALVAAEISWVLYAWQITYVIGGNNIIIPQATLVLLGVGYCFASIYQTHTEKRLSRRRLIEYVAIAGVLLAIVIAGTRWNGTA